MRIRPLMLTLVLLGCGKTTQVPDASDETDAAMDADALPNADADTLPDDASLLDASLPDTSVPDSAVPDAGPTCTAPSGASSDACCPPTGNANNDVDCSPVCGNGVQEQGELCDTAVLGSAPGACPTTCTPTGACDATGLVPDGCDTRCVHTPITTPSGVVMDGCCPAAGSMLTDADCAPVCGNGVKEAGEACDTAAVGTDACPASCAPRVACEAATLAGALCTAQCTYTPITVASGNTMDGCCPPNATANTDADCMAVCGNGVREAGEVCDTGIITGGTDACPASCEPAHACDSAVMTGSACTAVCAHTTIAAASGAVVDGCCPSGVDARTDIDCGPVCGNDVLEIGEICDRAASTTDATCEGMCQDFRCRGERYDINGLTTDGCEISDSPLDNHSQANAYDLGSYSCVDALSAFTVSGSVPHDLRVHHMPAVNGFVAATAAAPDYYRVFGQGGPCVNNVAATLQFPSGGACHRLTVTTSATTLTCTTNAGGMCSVSAGASSYADGTYLYFRVERICSSTLPAERAQYVLSGTL